MTAALVWSFAPYVVLKYELRRQIASGGMGVIFEAKELNPNRLVALKMIRAGELASAEEREWFRREAQEASLCLQCLQKKAERRCSAEQLADELERFLRGEPVSPRPLGWPERS